MRSRESNPVSVNFRCLQSMEYAGCSFNAVAQELKKK